MKITVTAGHGENDPGACRNGAIERDLMTELRDLVSDRLLDAGHTVRNDGKRWQNLPLVHAMTLVPGSAWAVELHTNSNDDPRATGVEVVSMPADKLRAQRLARAIGEALGMRLRGEGGWIDQTQTARGKLGFVRVGGMVVETFFISNPADLATYQARKLVLAAAIARVLGGA